MVNKLVFVIIPLLISLQGFSQTLTMQQALEEGESNYGSIKSKKYTVEALNNAESAIEKEYLPNVVLSAQQVYGTINGQNGPLYGFGGFGVASSGLPLNQQNWNAAFGALYLANVNWEFFTFGKVRGRVEVARANKAISEENLSQEIFQHQVRVAAAYLNVLASQRLKNAQQKNLERASVFQRSVVARARTGLIAGVDSSLANAEVSNAKIALIRAVDLVQQETQKLSLLLGRPGANFELDSLFVNRVPSLGAAEENTSALHPVLRFYRSRVDYNLQQAKLTQKLYYPSLNLVGIFQKRASGFEAEYVQDQTAFSHSYIDGISPTRTNYLIGVGLTWNLMSISRTFSQMKSAKATVLASQADYELKQQELESQRVIAEQKLANALSIYSEAPVQVLSATSAFEQKNALYKNGLSTIVDVTQTLYTLNRAETDRDLAYINVWQALLMKAAATGDMTFFTKEL
jgi:outer membrane protein TolC